MEAVSHWKAAYDAWAVRNVSLVGTLESAARTLSYVLPSSVPDTELASEIVFALARLASIYNDALIATRFLHGPHTHKTMQSRYAAALVQRLDYKRIAYLLTLVQAAELLIEMVTVRLLGKQRKWRVVLFLETIKMVCRLLLINLTKRRMVLQSMVPDSVRNVPSSADSGLSGSEDPPAESNSVWTGARSNRTFATLAAVRASPFTRAPNVPGATDNGVLVENDTTHQALEYLLSQSEVIDGGPAAILTPLDDVRLLAEALYAIRPVIYVLAILKFGANSWKPWLLSLAIEAASRGLVPLSKQSMSATEREEYGKRNMLFLFYLLRQPLFGSFTKDFIFDIAGAIERLPLGSLVAGGLRDYSAYWENYFYYTNAS